MCDTGLNWYNSHIIPKLGQQRHDGQAKITRSFFVIKPTLSWTRMAKQALLSKPVGSCANTWLFLYLTSVLFLSVLSWSQIINLFGFWQQLSRPYFFSKGHSSQHTTTLKWWIEKQASCQTFHKPLPTGGFRHDIWRARADSNWKTARPWSDAYFLEYQSRNVIIRGIVQFKLYAADGKTHQGTGRRNLREIGAYLGSAVTFLDLSTTFLTDLFTNGVSAERGTSRPRQRWHQLDNCHLVIRL